MKGVAETALRFSETSTLVSEIATCINSNNLKTKLTARVIWKYRPGRQNPNRAFLQEKKKKKKNNKKPELSLDSESSFPFLKNINGNYILVYGF